MGSAAEDAFVEKHRGMVQDGPQERASKSFKTYAKTWAKTPLALKIVFIAAVVLLPSVGIYVIKSAAAAPVAEQGFVIAFGIILFLVLVLVWSTSDGSVSPWIAMQLAVLGGTL